jgi:hypothetical protein
MPVDFSEASVEHGCLLLDDVASMFVPIESRPFVTLDYDLRTADDWLSLFYCDLTLEGRVTDAVVKVRYTATEEHARRVDHSELSKALYDAGAHKVYAIQPTILGRTAPHVRAARRRPADRLRRDRRPERRRQVVDPERDRRRAVRRPRRARRTC